MTNDLDKAQGIYISMKHKEFDVVETQVNKENDVR